MKIVQFYTRIVYPEKNVGILILRGWNWLGKKVCFSSYWTNGANFEAKNQHFCLICFITWRLYHSVQDRARRDIRFEYKRIWNKYLFASKRIKQVLFCWIFLYYKNFQKNFEKKTSPFTILPNWTGYRNTNCCVLYCTASCMAGNSRYCPWTEMYLHLCLITPRNFEEKNCIKILPVRMFFCSTFSCRLLNV